jgi:DNA-binding LacI/PurR family transcriptional regulator
MFDSNISRLRISGYRDAYQAQGLDPQRYLHYCDDYDSGLHDETGRDRVWGQLKPTLEKHPQITAILAPNDLAALQFYEALLKAGIRVPEDMSLIGFDDTHPIHRGDGENILTTVRVPLDAMGRAAANLCLCIIRGEAPLDQQIMLPVEFVERSSCRPCRP